MVLGIALGVAIGPTAGVVDPYVSVLVGNWLALPGKLFLLAIQFVVVPLVVASVIRGIAAGEGSDSLGRLGGVTVGFFVTTALIAVVIGLAASLLIRPGDFVDGEVLIKSLATDSAESPAATVPPLSVTPKLEDVPETIFALFPRDPLTSFLSGNMLQVVLSSLVIGIALVMTPPAQSRPLLELLGSIQAACMAVVSFVLKFAPYAVFGLLANITSRVGLSALIGTAAYVATVIAGLAFLFVLFIGTAAVLGRCGVGKFLGSSREIMLLAFSTSSSAAVMPMSLKTAETKLNVHPSIARFVIPLATTINMGGTALYQGVATLFLAQVFAIDIGIGGMLLIVVMATGAAIGSPGTPGVGIVILATILNTVGVPSAGIAIILGVDRLLDMCRTMVNVSGDLAACVTIDRFLTRKPESDELGCYSTPKPRPWEIRNVNGLAR